MRPGLISTLSAHLKDLDMIDSSFFDLTGRVALVTGASSGIGAATAIALAQAGADVVLGVRTPSKARKVAEQITGFGRRSYVVEMDVTDLPQCDAAIQDAAGAMGPIDILVNNAGGGIEGLALEAKPADFDTVVAQNVKAPYFLSQSFARALIPHNQTGDIINVSSQAALVALPGESIYCLAKAALSHMTRCLAVEWGEHNIKVNAVAPTFIETPGTANALSDPAFKADTIERIAALRRLGKPEEVAASIVYLASPAAALVTGHTLVIDGGWTIR